MNPTTKQLKTLGVEAAQAGDLEMAAIVEIALWGESDIDPSLLMPQARAKTLCVAALDAAASAIRDVRPTTIVRKPVGVNCSEKVRAVVGSLPAAPGGALECRGTMSRIDASRLEEGLGHELFECSWCHRRVKFVPPGVAGNFVFGVVR